MTELYFGMMWTLMPFLIVAVIATFIFYMNAVFNSPWRTRQAQIKSSARKFLIALFGGPLVVVLWPLMIPAVVVWGFSIVIRHAIHGGKTT